MNQDGDKDNSQTLIQKLISLILQALVTVFIYLIIMVIGLEFNGI